MRLAKVREYLDRVLVGELQKEGAQIRYLDLGGGLGINYNDETPPLTGRVRQGDHPRVWRVSMSR